ncbi:LOG family protein [Mariprofundus aestuarium]|uniref:LOG family protein n=1 Tax=Mariprofundus aestuarium TaxID=1921086 RepID=UPI000C222ABE|nr:LOG family protein [Mariprofundus aestuarium]
MNNIQRPRLTAFGSSRLGPEKPEYGDVFALSKSIAEAGWDGMTGGHQGMMAAFSEGIYAGGGHIRGITLERFPTPPNNTLSEEIRSRDFFTRMGTLIEEAQAWLVLPGGLGTLAEVAMTWDLLAIRVLEPRPLLLYGEMWEPVIETLSEQLVLSADSAFESIQICHNHEDVLQALKVHN